MGRDNSTHLGFWRAKAGDEGSGEMGGEKKYKLVRHDVPKPGGKKPLE